MSKITGIIAEFNPFHNGHRRLLTVVEGAKVIVMSGNWMQRGEPALIDKWVRAEMALRNGADLVVEMPLLTAVQGADFFASGAVKILEQLGVTDILFGSEEEMDYQHISEIYTAKADEMAIYMKELPKLMSYPLKAQKAWEHFTDIRFDGNTPNHILGLAYAKAVSGTAIQLHMMRRNVGYNDCTLNGSIASATAIRKNIEQSKDFVPENCWKLLQISQKTNWADFWSLLKYKITLGNLTKFYQVNDELANRIKMNIQTANDLPELIEAVYTKRYTKGHIRRVLCYILLDIPKVFELPEQIHVLGFTAEGQKILSNARGQLCTRIGQQPWDLYTQTADAIYRLGNPKIEEQTYKRKPIIV